MKKELEHTWEEIIDRIVSEAGPRAKEAIEKNWKYYFQYFFEYFGPHIKEDNSRTLVLDVGCGTGLISRELAQMGFQVYGVDFSSQVIKVAQRYAPKVHFQHSSIYKLPFSDETFHIILCLGVFQTVAEPKKALQEISRVLKKDGLLVIRTLNTFSLTSLRGRRDPFLNFYNPLWFQKAIEKESFESISLKGIYLFPKELHFFTEGILRTKLYRIFNFLFFPIFIFFSHSFYIEGIKK